MKILIVATLAISTAITVVHQRQLRTEQHLAKHARIAEQGRLWGAREEARYWKRMAEGMVREVECYALPKYNNPRQPDSFVNDPGAYWYS